MSVNAAGKKTSRGPKKVPKNCPRLAATALQKLTIPGPQHDPPQHVLDAGHCTFPAHTCIPGPTHCPFWQIESPGQQRPPQPTLPEGHQMLPAQEVPGGPLGGG
jgi:hypothetical protein